MRSDLKSGRFFIFYNIVISRKIYFSYSTLQAMLEQGVLR